MKSEGEREGRREPKPEPRAWWTEIRWGSTMANGEFCGGCRVASNDVMLNEENECG